MLQFFFIGGTYEKQKYISPILENIRNTDFTNDLTIAHNYAVEYINTVDNMRVYPDKKRSIIYHDLMKTYVKHQHQMPKYFISSENMVQKLQLLKVEDVILDLSVVAFYHLLYVLNG